MTVNTWESNWPERFRSIVRGLGGDNVFAFVISMKGQSFGKIFGNIRRSVNKDEKELICLRYLIETYYIDAEREGKLREAVIEALVRSFCQFMSSGWNCGKNIRSRKVRVQGNWEFPSFVTHQNWEYLDWIKFRESVWSEIELIKPPDLWCPQDYRDPILIQVFNSHWIDS